jgi:hypothetical protein
VDDVVHQHVTVIIDAVANLSGQWMRATDRVVAVAPAAESPSRIVLTACGGLVAVAVAIETTEGAEIAVFVVAHRVADLEVARLARAVGVVAIVPESHAPVVITIRVTGAIAVHVGSHVLAAPPCLGARIGRACDPVVTERRLEGATSVHAPLAVGAVEVIDTVRICDAKAGVANERIASATVFKSTRILPSVRCWAAREPCHNAQEKSCCTGTGVAA